MARARNSLPSEWPEGFRYQADFLAEAEERELLARIGELQFQAFDYQGYIAKRRIVDYGWSYDYASHKTSPTKPLPKFLMPLRDRAATFAELAPEKIIEAVVTEYPPGAPIGWHRDVPQFETIVGISLANACRMRLKPYEAEGGIVSVTLEPRSIYVISGVARWKFQHSIPAVEKLRYSITFRTLRAKRSREPAETAA
jgi:alkylated DNA repair dioxygenase AlkB